MHRPPYLSISNEVINEETYYSSNSNAGADIG